MSLSFVRAALAAMVISVPLAASPVKLGEQFFHKDWSAVCDNSLACEAISLMPDGDGGEGPQIIIRRGSGDAAVSVRIQFAEPTGGRYRVLVGGRVAASGTQAAGDWPIMVDGDAALKLVRAIARGRTLSIEDGNGVLVGKRELAGSAAALNRIDAIQNRAGTRQALSATGRRVKPLKLVPLPVVEAKRIGKQGLLPDAATIVGVVEGSKCATEPSAVTENSAVSLGRADGQRRALLLVSCGSGAYNAASAFYFGTSADGKRWDFVPARFDYPEKPDEGMDGATLLSNVAWDASRQQLDAFHKGRGLGDCGQAQSYVWDGAMFRLIEARAMDECRGVAEWPVVWRARVQFRD